MKAFDKRSALVAFVTFLETYEAGLFLVGKWQDMRTALNFMYEEIDKIKFYCWKKKHCRLRSELKKENHSKKQYCNYFLVPRTY